MDKTTIIHLLTNSGLNVFGMDNEFVYFQDPSCIFPAFDNFLNFAWIVVLVFTAIMLFGWGVLYIKNNVNINSLFNNAKTLILVLCVLSLTKPIVNVIYGENLFAKQCETKHVSLSVVQELLDSREKQLGTYGPESNFEIFSVIDSWSHDILPRQPSTQTTTFENDSYSVSNMETSPNLLTNTNVSSIQYQNNATIYILLNGTRISRSGGSASWRNNNPGNIIKSKFALNNGAIGTTDRWAVFRDEETGLNAMKKLLLSKNYADLSIRGAINRWAPSSDNNNPEKYANFVAKTAGLSIDARIKDLSADDLTKMVRAMQKFEGWIPGIEKII